MTTEYRNSAPDGRDPGGDAALELFLSAGRAAPEPPADLMARILGDAAQSAGQPQLVAAGAAPLPRRGLLQAAVAALGGWTSLTGMAAATMTGVWLGFTMPSLVEDSGVFGSDYTLADLMPAVDLALAEPGGAE